MISVVDEASQLAEIDDIELHSLGLGEFVLDSGDVPSLEVQGKDSPSVRVAIVGSHLRIEGTAPPPPRFGPYAGRNALEICGSYVAGTGPLSIMVSPGTDPFRVRAALGDVRIRLTLPPGKHVRVETDFGTFSTPAPLAPAARREILERTAAAKCDPLLRKAAERRARADSKVEEARQAEAAGKSAKAESRLREAEMARQEAEELECQAHALFEALTRSAELPGAPQSPDALRHETERRA